MGHSWKGGNSFTIEIWGNYACFTRPEFKVEKVSYDVITPSAARGVFDAIFWHPGMYWQVHRIYVLNPVKTMNMKRNELSDTKIRPFLFTQRDFTKQEFIVQRNSHILKDVHYIVEATIEIDEDRLEPRSNLPKFVQEAGTRFTRGQCFHAPWLGCREYEANVRLWDASKGNPADLAIPETKDLGIMLYDKDYDGTGFKNPARVSQEEPIIESLYFHAVMNNGIIDIPNRSEVLARCR